MNTILQLTKQLVSRPLAVAVPDVNLRTFSHEADIEIWLEMRRRAFARSKLGVRDWNASEFLQEFSRKTWWNPALMWFAESCRPGQAPLPIGSVTLARRGDSPKARPVVHWLIVLPSYRRHGIGRLLMATLEAAAWDLGERQIWLETHHKWIEAVSLYRQLGYTPTTPE